MTVIEGEGILLFQAMVLKTAINFYIRHGIKAGSQYTPGNMLRTVTKFTGKKYRRGLAGLTTAVYDLDNWIEEHKKEAR